VKRNIAIFTVSLFLGADLVGIAVLTIGLCRAMAS